MSNKTIRVPILNVEYKVIVCWGTPAYVAGVFRRYHYPPQLIGTDGFRGRCYYHKGCFPIILMSARPSTSALIGTLAHEAVHAVDWVFDMIEEKRSDEVYAHSVGAIVREVLAGVI